MAWFFRSKLKHPDEKVRLQALQKLTDPSKIVGVACQDDSPTVRLEAVRKLSDPNHLSEVVKEGEGLEARVQAVGRIQDQKLLAQILLERKNNAIMEAALLVVWRLLSPKARCIMPRVESLLPFILCR